MATETERAERTATDTGVRAGNWKAGVLGGLAGGLVFGAMMSMMMTPVIEMAIPALYGIEGPAGIAGWVIHMSNSAVFGVVFAALAGLALGRHVSFGKSVGLGVVYGVLLWLIFAVFVMPVWLSAVGFPGAPALPNISVMSLVGHVVYGAVLGAVYPLVLR